MTGKIINWQYPGEEVNRILGADSYTIVDTAPKYNTTQNFNYTITAKAVISEDSPPPSASPSLPKKYRKGEIIEVVISGTWSGGIYEFKRITQAPNVNVELTYLERSGGNSQVAYCAKRTTIVIPYHNGKRVKSGSGSYTEPVVFGDFFDVICTPTSTAPRACIDSVVEECAFKIFDALGNVVYQRTEDVCPIAWEEDIQEECPPGTCEVECHGKICCYNSQGISIKSFTR